MSISETRGEIILAVQRWRNSRYTDRIHETEQQILQRHHEVL